MSVLGNTPFTEDIATTADLTSGLSGKAAAVHAHAGEDVTSGTVADARIASTIARDSEVTAAVAAEATARDTAIGVETSARTTADGLLVPKSLYDANTVLAANTDDTPAAVTMAASTILARLASGNIKAASVAEIKTLLAFLLDDLSDVAITTPAAGHRIEYDGAGWVNLTDRFRWACPTNALYETSSRAITRFDQSLSLTSQRLQMCGLYMPKGVVVTSISVRRGSAALSGGVHQIFGLYDSAIALLRGSSDDTSTAWAQKTTKTLTLTSTFTTTYAGLHYIGVLVDASTAGNLASSDPGNDMNFGITPLLFGSSTTSVTALPNPAAAITGTGQAMFYAYVS